MVPRWFRVVLVGEIAGLAAFVVLGVHVATHGAQATGAALQWLRPRRPAVSHTLPRSATVPSLLAATGSPGQHALYGAALLNPSLMVRLNRDTGATAVGEYALLLNLEALAREELTRLLGTVSVAPSAVPTGN